MSSCADIIKPAGLLLTGASVLTASPRPYHLAVRTGWPTPVITLEPADQYQIQGGSAAFTAKGDELYSVTYQWQLNGVNIVGATNADLILANVPTNQQGDYRVIISDNYGSITSSVANFTIVTPPALVSWITPTNVLAIASSNLTFSVVATAPGESNGFPISYQWQFDGTNIPGATASNYSFQASESGVYSVAITNAAGNTNVSWNVTVLYPGSLWAWGDDAYGQSDVPAGTNFAVIATGEFHSVAVNDDGSVVQWGYDFGQVPPDLTNAVTAAAGYEHSIAVRSDGTVVAWGANTYGETNVPANLFGVKAVAAGWEHNVALLTNGTVVAWGDNYFGQTNVPADLTNVIEISACSFHNLALKSDGTVEGWGYNYDGITTPPAGLSNVVAIAAGFEHSLALKSDGTVVAWGANDYGQCNVPTGLSNVMAIAAGWYHSAALKNDGTIVVWGDNAAGQTNTPNVFTNPLTKLIAAGGNHTVAALFSPLVQYPVDVTKDVLLTYNSNSTNSIAVKDYYVAHRPMIAGANVLGVACEAGEFFYTTNDWDAQLVTPVLNWLTNNPTKHPEYIILFYDIPMRLWLPGFNGCGSTLYSGSVSYHLRHSYPGLKPFVNNINQGTVADCEAYVDKLAYFGANYSPGKIVISAGAGGYGNTNYYFDDNYFGIYNPYTFANLARSGVLSVNPLASIIYSNPPMDVLVGHITSGDNVAGYQSGGAHTSLGATYATNGFVRWSGDSGWWVIQTIESFNGQRVPCGQGTFIQWFSANAFGGTNYSNTPVGAVCHTEEPTTSGVNDSRVYFSLWESKKNFAICAWASRKTPFFQAIGDPLVTK
jgi:hypothetical protein